MAASLGEIFIELGVFADTKELKDFENKLQQVSQKMNKTEKKSNSLTVSVGKFIKGVAGVAAAITGAIYALNRLTTSLVESNQEFLNLTRTSDISLGVFQKWNNVGRMFGVRNAAQQIENLNQRLFELKLTGQGAEGFMLAGINPMGQDAEGIMNQLRSRVSGLDDTSAAYLLRQMGLDPSMLHLLRLSRDEFEALGQTVKKYQLTKEQSEQIQALNAQLQIAQIKLKYLKDRAILAIMPYFVEFMTSLARVATLLLKITKAVGQFTVKWRALTVPLIIGLTKIKAIAKYFKAFGVALGEVITKLPIVGRLFASIGGFIAKALLPLTALYLILDDIATYIEGGDSLFGRVIDWFKDTGSGFGNIFSKMFGGDLFGGFVDLLGKLGSVLDDLTTAIFRLTAIITGIPVDKWMRNLANFVTGGHYDEIKGSANYIAPPTTNNRTNNISNADNRQVIMNNQIMTSQAGNAVISDLNYAQNYAFDFC